MWRELLSSILIEMRQLDLQPQPPCEQQEGMALDLSVTRYLGVSLPKEYLELLSIVDGLDWNGLVIFASQRRLLLGYVDRHIEGILDRNMAYRDNPDMSDYLVLGEDGTVVYCLDYRSDRYVILTAVGLAVLESYGTCSELFSSAMNSHL